MNNLTVANVAESQANEVLDSDAPKDLDWLIRRLENIRVERGGKFPVACTAGYQVPENEAMQDHHICIADDGATHVPGLEGPFLLIGGPGY